ncbi:unnamed protein product [Effrenium voratum]|nr:unnamed protein product [Effrenium voratum]
MRRILGLLPLAAADWGASTKGTKVLLTEAAADGAVCLDGSAPAYYIAPGSGDGANKWYIHHQGGGWCESLDDCLGRSKTALGSSSGYPETMELSSGYFSNSSSVNPLMYNWNKVHMSYCDGGSFSGDNDTVTVYKGAKLHFRGRRIREAIAKDLMAKGLGRASDLVVSGCSAGGLATYLHTDQWCHTLKSAQPSAKCVGLPDSGFFLDYQDPDVKCVPEEHMLTETINGDYHCGLRWTFGIQNATRGVDAKCLAVHSGEETGSACLRSTLPSTWCPPCLPCSPSTTPGRRATSRAPAALPRPESSGGTSRPDVWRRISWGKTPSPEPSWTVERQGLGIFWV